MFKPRKQIFLNRNEVLQGPAPKCLAVLKNFKQEEVCRYFEEAYCSRLAQKIAALHHFPEGQVLVGYGVEDFLRTIFDRLHPSEHCVLTHRLHYGYVSRYLALRGVPLKVFDVPDDGGKFTFDIQDCLRKCRMFHPKVVLIASPNNPTGNSISPAEMNLILKAADRTSIVMLDEAYQGFDAGYEEEKFMKLVRAYPNLIILRSFSKLYALAGLRIGYALAGREVRNLLRHENHYLGMSRVLEQVGIAALESKNYYARLSTTIVRDREWLTEQIRPLKHFKPYRSNANFVPVRVAETAVPPVERLLASQKFVIGKLLGENLLRVSVAPRSYLVGFVKALAEVDALTKVL